MQKDEEKELDDLNDNEVYEILAAHGLIDGRKNNELDLKAMYKGVRCLESLYLFHKVMLLLLIIFLRKASFAKYVQEFQSIAILREQFLF